MEVECFFMQGKILRTDERFWRPNGNYFNIIGLTIKLGHFQWMFYNSGQERSPQNECILLYADLLNFG